jgi:capsular polysaccharide biosynthesis protein
VPITALDTSIDYPAHHLRHYRGEIAMVSNALLHTPFTALPDSFRHHLSTNPTNPGLIDVSGDFARVRPRDRPRTRLEGSYNHLDSENSGHYGHLLTEVMSRLWGWDEAKRQLPDLKAIFRIRYANERKPVLEQRIFGAFGIDVDDIVWVHEPVWLESVVGATPMWHNQVPHYVHPGLMSVWDRVRASLLNEASAPTEGFDRSGGKRIFVSRQDISTNRACRNTREVESFFADRGFDVVYPENHDLAVQAAIFDRAEVVAGFGGSAMFNIVFSRDYQALILLNHEAYTARNEHLYTALLGGDIHYFWSTPDVPHPEGGWTEEAYYSSWAFDFERNSETLTEVIKNLG